MWLRLAPRDPFPEAWAKSESRAEQTRMLLMCEEFEGPSESENHAEFKSHRFDDLPFQVRDDFVFAASVNMLSIISVGPSGPTSLREILAFWQGLPALLRRNIVASANMVLCATSIDPQASFQHQFA
jgi:hypothetical protein